MSTTNKPLSREKKCLILALLTEGTSISATCRVTRTGINQVLRLLLDAGETARAYHNDHAMHLNCPLVEADELWSYIGCHQYRVPVDHDKDSDFIGHCWLLSATCATSKFVVSWSNHPERDEIAVKTLFDDIWNRVDGKFQLTTDKFALFLREMRARNDGRMSGGWEMKRFGGAMADDRTKRVVEVLLGIERGKVVGNPDIGQ